MFELEDGMYDVVVLEAREDDNATLHLQLAVSSGAHRGEVVHVTAKGLQRSWIDVLALPATLEVRDGEPTVRF